MTKVICGFPGIGKTTAFKEGASLDIDSSGYSWHPDFPANYLEEIQANLGKVDYIFVSTHLIVIQALQREGIEHTVVYPNRNLKEEYLQRYKDRGSIPNFLEFMEIQWDSFIDDIERTPGDKIKLESGQYLGEVLYSPKDVEVTMEFYKSQLKAQDEEAGAKLLGIVEKFMLDNDVLCEETIYQVDKVQENALEFIEELFHAISYRLPAEDADE